MSRSRLRGVALAFFVLSVGALYSFGGGVPFKAGERVVCFGDSITHGGSYTFYMQLYLDLRYPGLGVEMLNGGISGDTAGGGIRRWESDILPKEPQTVMVMFGMNDVGRGNYATAEPNAQVAAARKRSLAAYRKNMSALAAKIEKSGVRAYFVTPSPYDQYGNSRAKNMVACNEPGLVSCAEIVRELAKSRAGAGLLELHRPMTALIKANLSKNLCGADRVHPGGFGHLLMATLLLEQLIGGGEQDGSQLVAMVDVDASGMTWKGERATVSELKGIKGGVAFRYEPKALPFPVLSEYKELEEIYPVTEKLNREIVRVKGLSAGTYALKADGKEIGRFSGAELAKGVNIATLNTPSQRTAMEASKKMYELRSQESQLRAIPYMNSVIARRKGKVSNMKESFAVLDAWIAELEVRKVSTLKYYKSVVKTYKTVRPQFGARCAKIENLRQEMRKMAKPSAFMIEIVAVK